MRSTTAAVMSAMRLALVTVAGGGCGADDHGSHVTPRDAAADAAAPVDAAPADTGPPPLYAIMHEVYADMGSNSYLSLLDSLDVKHVDIASAREYAGGRAFLATHNGWVFVGHPTEPIVTRFSVGDDGKLKDERRLSFGREGAGFRSLGAGKGFFAVFHHERITITPEWLPKEVNSRAVPSFCCRRPITSRPRRTSSWPMERPSSATSRRDGRFTCSRFAEPRGGVGR